MSLQSNPIPSLHNTQSGSSTPRRSLVVGVPQLLDDLRQLAVCAAGVDNGGALVLGSCRVTRRTNASLQDTPKSERVCV